MKFNSKLRYILLGIVIGAGGLLSVSVFGSKTFDLKKLSEFTQVYKRIKQIYVDEVDDAKLVDGAIAGMLQKLDPHSTFLPPKQAKQLLTSIQGEFGGLGIEVQLSDDGYVKVVSPIDDTPAAKAGILAGDLIVKLDDKPVKGLTLSEAVDIMRGRVGEKIMLTILRQGEKALIKKEITRDKIQVQSVRSRLLDKDYGYLRIGRFQANTGPQLDKNIDKMLKQNPDLKGVVLDLRNNPGGALNAAVDVSSSFMDGGLVVYTKGRIANSNQKFSAQKGEKLPNLPVVVLINEGSASASEIVAGALQDTNRAIVMGRTSFGKGSVQTVTKLNNSKSRLKLTTAKYYTPKGTSIQATGITPDIEIPRMKIEVLKSIERVKEKNLKGHLENEQISTGTISTKTTSAKKVGQIENFKAKDLIKKDYELYMALSTLKGLSLKK